MENERGFVDTTDNQKEAYEKYIDDSTGPYIAQVKYNVDPLKMGRLGVNIGALSSTAEPKPDQVIWCQYLSPFYGSKSIRATSKTDPLSYQYTQHSYGMWAVPPDIDTHVLVMFAKGEKGTQAFWIGCIQDPVTNYMVPGLASNSNTGEGVATAGEFDVAPGQAAETSKYGTEFLPAGEKNRRILDATDTLDELEKWQLPLNVRLADQLRQEGLVQDTVRGTTSSSARRETPSNVFGWSTPGPLLPGESPVNIGLEGLPTLVNRGIGHTFVMDDGDALGNNQLTRLRTSTGHQLLMNDTNGVVYLANGSGKAWIEMDREGKIVVYSSSGISFRTEGDFNLHSDNNIQFHAKNKINFTSENDVTLNAEKYVYVMGDSGILSASQNGAVRHYGKLGISSYTPEMQLHGAGKRIDLASGGEVHFNSVSAQEDWGPTWLVPDHAKVGITSTGAVDIVHRDEEGNDVPPINGEKINTKITNTTVSEFVTHEPFERTSVDTLLTDFKENAIKSIIKENPNLQNNEIKNLLKSNPNISGKELAKAISSGALPIETELNNVISRITVPGNIDDVFKTVENLTAVGNNLKLNPASLKNLKNNAEAVKSSVKNKLTNIINAKIKDAVDQGLSAVKKYF